MLIVSCFKRLTCLFFIHNGSRYYTAPAYMQKRAVSRPMNPRYGGFVRLASAAHLVLHKGPVIIYWGGGGDLGLNKAKFSRFPLWLLFYRSDPPLITFDDFRDPLPHVFIFQANLSGPPSESFQSFQQSPLLGSQLRLIPPFVLPKIKWPPPPTGDK